MPTATKAPAKKAAAKAPKKTLTAAQKRAHEVAATVNKQLGTNSVEIASDEKYIVTYLPTGILPIDCLLGGGLPRGRFTTFTGDFSTLKSYIGYMAIAETQRNGGLCVLIDTEHAFDPLWAESCGIDIEALIIERPENGELAIDVVQGFIGADVDLIVFDSVAATVPQAESKKRLHDENIQPGRLAALMSAAMRRLTAVNRHTAVLWINQLREGIGVMFGPSEKATAGKALPYYSSYIVNIRKTGKITQDIKMFTGEKFQSTKEQIGQNFKAELQKSKLSKPFRESWFAWSMTDVQIDEVGYAINQAVDNGIIHVDGQFWTYNGEKTRGRENFQKMVAGTPSVAHTLVQEVRALHGLEYDDKPLVGIDAPVTTPVEEPAAAPGIKRKPIGKVGVKKTSVKPPVRKKATFKR